MHAILSNRRHPYALYVVEYRGNGGKGMTQEELQAIRLVMREEIGAAISASEQRTGKRFDSLEARVVRMDGRIDQLDQNQRNSHSETILFKAEMRMGLMRSTTETQEAIRNFKTDVRKDLELFKTEARQEWVL